MQFHVPQFIETEDRIIGPLTLKQFLYVAAGGGISFLLFFLLETWLWILATFFIATISASLAFIKINGQPLIKVATAALKFYWQPRMYLWKQEIPKTETMGLPKIPTAQKESALKQARSLLDNLWEQLKTSKQPVPKREKPFQPSITDRPKSNKERFEMMRKITGEREIAKRIDYR